MVVRIVTNFGGEAMAHDKSAPPQHSLAKVAQMLDVSKDTVMRLVRCSGLAVCCIGGEYYFNDYEIAKINEQL